MKVEFYMGAGDMNLIPHAIKYMRENNIEPASPILAIKAARDFAAEHPGEEIWVVGFFKEEKRSG